MPILKNPQQHQLLLDTHIWIWLMAGKDNFSPSFLKIVDQSREKNRLFISVISVWEVGMLVEKGKINFEIDTMDWVEQSSNHSGITILPLTPTIAIESCRLFGNLHGDPVDRMLVATAHEFRSVLVTHDKKLIEYGKNHLINVYDPAI